MLSPKQRWQILAPVFEAALAQETKLREAFVRDQLAEHGLEQDEQLDLAREIHQMLSAHDGPALAFEHATQTQRPAALPARIGPYRIVKRIAQGGMGEVLLGERADHAFERRVAIKTLKFGVHGSHWSERFRREQAIHAQLEHPNIAHLMDAGLTKQGTPYLVMDYVAGETIVAYVQSKRITLRQRASLVAQVCDAVAFAHNRLILHRDIKPSNILVDSDDQVKLLDFGIAKLLDEGDSDPSLTRTGQHLMTPRYASPEQIRGESLTVTSDVYSLGVVLYELLTGQPPFDANTDFKLSQKVLETNPLVPREADPTVGGRVPADLQAICLKAIEKVPERRYASAAEMGDDLRRFIEHRSVQARKPSWIDRLRRATWRHPIAVPLGALAIVSTLTGAGIATWQAQVAGKERDIARTQRDRAEEVTAVLTDLFDSDPFGESEQRRADVTLREFLIRRAATIDSEFADQPSLRARLNLLFANLLVNMSLLEEATPYAEQAVLSYRDADAGQPTAELAQSLTVLATLRQQQALFSEAEVIFREVLEIRRKLHGEMHALTAVAYNNLGTLLNYWDDGSRDDEQMAMFEQAAKINVELSGPNSLDAAMSYNGLGIAYLERGRPQDLERAIELMNRTLDIRRDQLGENHPSTGTILSNIANTLHDMDRFDEAESHFRQALASIRRSLGPEHTRVADVLYGFGHLQLDQGDPAASASSFEQSLSIYRTALGQDHPFTAETGVAYGRALLANEQTESAIPILESAIATLARFEHSAAERLGGQRLLAEALAKTGQSARARELARATLTELGEDLDESDPARQALTKLLTQGAPANR